MLATLKGHADSAVADALPDGKWLTSCSNDGIVWLTGGKSSIVLATLHYLAVIREPCFSADSLY